MSGLQYMVSFVYFGPVMERKLRIVVDFFNHVNMLYGTISEFCTPEKVS